ncbi:MAG: hypothetical protein PSU93_09510 [Methylobacter sp.]|uniref:Uncharacterized protein n=1 Tax=Candidatus Methylobacter titanis TaxID=3053457 RepID=A0AA43Q8S9_9GAMM|nr:hypothetical protein [Candidatus Methylobacter titanis]
MFEKKLEDILQQAQVTETITNTTNNTTSTFHVSITDNSVQNFGDIYTIYREGRGAREENQKGAVKSGQN